jgi:hypothetical protein
MTGPVSDSRDYVVAFAIGSSEDCPPDLELPDSLARFDAGLFLPGDNSDRFGRPAWPPRVLLLDGGALEIVSHPSAGEPARHWDLEQISAVESGHMFLKGRLRFTGAGFDYTVRYNTRGAPSVWQFMRRFRKEWLRDGRPRDAAEVHRGEGLDIKFANALERELDSQETVHLQVFQAPEVSRKLRLTGDLLAVTERRLLWITDRENGFRSRYGTIASYAPIGAVTHAARAPDSLRVGLNGSHAWHVPIAPAYLRAAEELANLVTASIRNGANLI